MGHQQDFLSLHDPPGRASSLGRPNPVSYLVSKGIIQVYSKKLSGVSSWRNLTKPGKTRRNRLKFYIEDN